jgi:hypothetical protein
MHGLQFDTVTLLQLLIIGFAVERLTEIVVESKIFEPFRKAIGQWATIDPRTIDPDKPLPKSAVLKEYVSYFVKCGYCMSVWIGAAASLAYPVSLYRHQLTDTILSNIVPFAVNFITSTLLYHGIANWLHVAFKRLQVGVVDVKDIKVTVEDSRNAS